jgi:hypothetical protein
MLMATIEREGIGSTSVDPEPTIKVPSARHRRDSLARIRPERRPAGGFAGQPPFSPVRSRRTRGAILVGLAAGAVALSGMSAASGDAIPGDPLYGIKRSTEQAQLALAGSDISRGQLYLEFAKTRMNEAYAVRTEPAGLATVLDDMDADTRRGVKLLATAAVDRHEPAALDAVDAFVAGQRRALSGLIDGLNGPARDRVQASLTLLDSIKRRSGALRGNIAGCSGTASGLDALGPVPRTCGAEPRVRHPETETVPGAVPAGQLPGRVNAGSRTDDASHDPAAPDTTGTPEGDAPLDGLIDDLAHLLGNLLN